MPQIKLVGCQNDGKPLTLADIAQFIADLTAAGVPASAVPVFDWLWTADDGGALSAQPATLLACYVTAPEAVAAGVELQEV
jgi:hypothetical protein